MSKFFSYYWTEIKNDELTIIRAYGLNAKNKNVCMIVTDFKPYCYIELPLTINHTNYRLVVQKIKELDDKNTFADDPVFVQKKKLYYANVTSDNHYRLFPFVKVTFHTREQVKQFSWKFSRPINIIGIGRLTMKVHELEASPILQFTSTMSIPTAGWIKFMGVRVPKHEQITSCDFEYKVSYKNVQAMEHPIVAPLCLSFDIEVNSSVTSAMPKSSRDADRVFQVSCVFWRYGEDIEKSEKYLLTLGKPNTDIIGQSVHTITFDTEAELLLGFTDLVNKLQPNIIMGYNIFTFDIPYMLERAKKFSAKDFSKMGFLINAYAAEREISWSSSAYKNQKYKFIDAEGRLFVDLLPIIRRDHAKFDSYSLKKVSTFFLGVTKDPLDAKGIFQCYREGMAAEEDTATERERIRGRKALGIVGKYCVQDSMLVMKLFKTLNVWTGITEMAKVCNVPIFATYTQGQQLRVFSQLYKKCVHDDVVIDKNNYIINANDMYVGASVHKPTKHYFKNVLPFDFTSLYPTTIIAYNICWSTLVNDTSETTKDKNVKDSDCHVMSWEDHVNCCHDKNVIKRIEIDEKMNEIKAMIKKFKECLTQFKNEKDKVEAASKQIEMLELKLKPLRKERQGVVKSIGKRVICGKRYFRWLKQPMGILPTIASNLLETRRNTKKEMKGVKVQMGNFTEFSDEWNALNTQYNVLDARQLALKVSCNSLYGALGVSEGRGYCPLMAGAMCTTYQGRMAIKKTIDLLTQKYGGELCHSDTDSSYCSFPFLKSPQECWEFALKTAKEISAHFPKPMEILYEEHIYEKFLILTKKRYMSIEVDKNGKSKLDENGVPEINKKGVLLTRRDNCEFVRHVYANVVMMIFNDKSRDEILNYIIDEINNLFSRVYDIDMFRITKSVGDIGSVQNLDLEDSKIQPRETEEAGKVSYLIGDYKVKPLSDDPEQRLEQFKAKDVTNERDYYLNCLPAQCVLAYKLLKNRGQIVHSGERIEYVIIKTNIKNPTQRECIESYEYAKRHRDSVPIDYYHYLHKLATPIDQILGLMYGEKYENLCLDQYKYRLKVRENVIDYLRKLSKPILKFNK